MSDPRSIGSAIAVPIGVGSLALTLPFPGVPFPFLRFELGVSQANTVVFLIPVRTAR